MLEPAEGQTSAGVRGYVAKKQLMLLMQALTSPAGPQTPVSCVLDRLSSASPPHPHGPSLAPIAQTPAVAQGQPPGLQIPLLQPRSHRRWMSKRNIQPANGSMRLHHQPLVCLKKKCGPHVWQTRCLMLGTRWQSRQTRPLPSGISQACAGYRGVSHR